MRIGIGSRRASDCNISCCRPGARLCTIFDIAIDRKLNCQVLSSTRPSLDCGGRNCAVMSASNSPQGHHAPGSDHGQGPPRKKMRKGTRSCIECRRRKIKCTFEPGRTSICNECFARGSTCIDQEHGDVSSFTTHSSTSQQKDEQNATLKERVNFLEDLVKQVLDRLPENNNTAAVAASAAVAAGVTARTQVSASPGMQEDAQAGKHLTRTREQHANRI